MPATSLKQKKFMDAVAHNKAFATQVGVPQSVGKDFSEASKGMKFGKGSKSRADVQAINKPKTNQGATELFKKGGNMATKKMNPFAKFEKSSKDVEKKGVKEGSKKDMMMDKMQMKKMAGGGMASSKMGAVKTASPSKDGVASKGKTKGTQIVMAGNKGMKNGGKC
jgi:hypothetical protein